MASDFEKTLEAKSGQINNVDLVNSMDITVKGVRVRISEAQQVDISVNETEKMYRPCKGMRRVLGQLWGTDPSTWIGRKIRIYRDPDVRYGADIMGGIRISGLSDIEGEKQVTVPVSRGKVKTYTISRLQVAAPARDEAAEDAAMQAADGGKDAFSAWWNSDYGKASREAVRGIMPELQRRVAVWEAANPPPDDGDNEPPM